MSNELEPDFNERTPSGNQLINYQLKEIKSDVKEIKETLRTTDDRYVLRREYNELTITVGKKVDREDLRNLRNLGWTLLGSTLLAIIFTILNFISQGKIKP